MDLTVFNVYEGRYLFFTDEINEIIFEHEINDVDIIHDLENIILSLPRVRENTVASEDVYEAFDDYFKELGYDECS